METRWEQIQRGRFSNTSTSMRMGAVRVFRDRVSLGSQRRCDLPPGTLVLGTVGDAKTQARWFGMPVRPDDLAVGWRTIDVCAAGPGELLSALIDTRVLAGGFPNFRAATSGGAADDAYLVRDATLARGFRSFVLRLFDGVRSRHVPAAATNRAVEAAMLGFLRPGAGAHAVLPGASSGRFLAVRACDAFMGDHIDETISLRALADVSGFRPRSLINAFEALTGVSPMVYLKAKRLNGVRATLRTTRHDETRIIDIAMNFGFDHLGHFAADYRAMFGERPSETARAQAPARQGAVLV